MCHCRRAGRETITSTSDIVEHLTICERRLIQQSDNKLSLKPLQIWSNTRPPLLLLQVPVLSCRVCSELSHVNIESKYTHGHVPERSPFPFRIKWSRWLLFSRIDFVVARSSSSRRAIDILNMSMDSSGVLICDLISVSDTPTTLSSLTSKTVVFSLSQSSASLGIQAGNDATIFHHNVTLYFWVYPAPPCSQPNNSVILSSLCCQNIFKLKTWWYPCWHLTVGIVQGSMIEQISSKIPVQTARPGSRNVWIMWGDVTVLLLCIHTIWRNPCPCHKKCTPNTGDSSAVTKTDITAAGSCSVVTTISAMMYKQKQVSYHHLTDTSDGHLCPGFLTCAI